MEKPATVFVVDDDAAVRESMKLLLSAAGLEVRAFDGAAAVLPLEPPVCRGCIIVDVRMPGMDGLRLAQELSQRGWVLPVIFLTGHGDIPMSVRAIKAGAVDFLTKPVSRAVLLESVRVAISQSEKLRANAADNQSAEERLAGLTERERQVLALAVTGHTNKQIARELGISHRTVEIHRSRIMQKTGAGSVPELVRLVKSAQWDGGDEAGGSTPVVPE